MILQKPTWREVVFSFKSFFAAMLALYIAFRLDLSEPMWAVTTVYVVSQPLAGMVLSKSMYRVLGTVIGAIASLVFVALFSNSPELFCLALALWMGLGTAVSVYLRDAPQGYVGMLSGYSAALIGLAAALAPESAFDIAVARCLEITLGIGCATLVHHLVFPQRAGDSLRKALNAALPDMARWAGDALRGQQSEAQGLIDRRRILATVVSLDRLRIFAIFDTPPLKAFDPAIRQIEGKLLSLLALLMSVYDRFAVLTRERPPTASELRPLLERAAMHLAQSAGARTPADSEIESADELALRAEIASRLPSVHDLRRDPNAFLVRSILLRLTDVIDLWRDSVWLRTHVSSGTRLQGSPASPAFHPYRDLPAALIDGAVTAIAVIAASAFWILSAWPGGPTAVTFTAIICAIMGGRDDPSVASVSFLRMSVVGAFFAACYLFVVLPPLTGFASLVAALAPFYLVCGLLLATPSTVQIVMPLIFTGGGLMAITNSTVYDFEAFLNNAVSYVVGIGMAVVALRLLRPRGAGWAVQRLSRGLFHDLAAACLASGIDNRAAFESRMFDRINALFARLDPMIAKDRAVIQGSLGGLRLGLNVLALRTWLPELPAAAAAPVRNALTALAGHFMEIAKGRGDKPLPLELLEAASRQVFALDESALTVRAAEALFSVAMTMRQHSEFFGEPSGDDAIDGIAAVTA
ncbi:FUSC family protein [Bradyrhizobium sp. dw_78]|uniref:FUSC family protein n=1 Tax=Bradyrhizobium sp. dw_78 TaxID=2719793 RepID=UPI001BD50D93|nr:FUSC family protein [Bradyrhizobium sp. dw_78]